MKTRYKFFNSFKCRLFSTLCTVVVKLVFGVLSVSAQTGTFLFTGSEVTITLNPGAYDITAYGAQGGTSYLADGSFGASGGLGAELEGQFDFTTSETLTLLVGGSGSDG
jgi:hypothetical protein